MGKHSRILSLCSRTLIIILFTCSVNENGEGSTFDNCSSSCIRLNSGTVLYLREVNKFLALVCILREENFTKQGLIDYNFQCFRKSIQDVFVHRLSETARASSANITTPYGSSNAPDADDTEVAVNEGDLATSYPNDSIDSAVMTNNNEAASQPIVNSSYKQTSTSPHIQANHTNHRKMAILPASSTVSSLPSHQMYHPAAATEKTPVLKPSSQILSQQWPFKQQ